jgi:tetratricopeptide (TPR) repeat protein
VPLLLPTYAGLSHAYLQAWKSDVDLWKYVLSLEPDNYLALTNLAGIAIEQGHFEVAKRLLDQAHAKAPHSPVLWSNYGYYWLYQAQNSSNKQPSGSNKQPSSSLPMAAQPSIATVSLEQSITAFQNALRLEPGRTLALLGLAKAYQQQGNFHQAYRLYVEAQQKQDGWERATEALYGLLWSKGRKDQARQTVITAIQTLGSSARLQQLLKRDQPNVSVQGYKGSGTQPR